ncbi:MAG TPA: hypothetical protein VF590_08170, partial [Isosphaeraceae bacterium]
PGGANSPPSATGGRIADADEIAALEAEIESLRRGILIRRTIPLLLWLVAAIGLALFFLGWL